jgi:hypothetical protein
MPRRTRSLALMLAGAVLSWVALFAMSIAPGAESKAKLLSEWPSAPVVIDGNAMEWPRLESIAKDVRFSIAVRNDDQTLCIALITSDRATAVQALNQGLVVWLDAAGGSKKRFGLHFPVGRPAGPAGGSGQGRNGTGDGRRGGSGGELPGEPPPGRDTRVAGAYGGQPPDAETMWNRATADGRLKMAELIGPETSSGP